MDTKRAADMLGAFASGLSTMRVGDKAIILLQGSGVQNSPLLVTANVSAAEPTSTPVSAYFTSGPEAQAEIIKLYSQLVAKDSRPSAALRTLFDLLFDSNAKAKPNPNRFRSELTVTHGLATPADWDRVSIFMVGLVPHDEEIRIVDTNQLESVIKDLEIGTLTQSGSAEASINAKRTVADVLKIDPLTETRGWELGPSAKVTYSEQLQRKLREQLMFRSSSIEKEGGLFRLSYRTNGSEQIPAMTRQVLTFEYRPREKSSLLLFEFDIDDNGSISKLSRLTVPNYVFEAQPKDPTDLATEYELKAHPILFALVRQIRNIEGVRTLAYDDDDDVELVPVIRPLQPVTIARVPIRRYAIGLGDQEVYISAKELPTDRPAVAVFDTEVAARRFLTWFAKSATARLNSPGTGDGLYLTAAEVGKYGTHRFGVVDLGIRDKFKNLNASEVARLVIVRYPRPPAAASPRAN